MLGIRPKASLLENNMMVPVSDNPAYQMITSAQKIDQLQESHVQPVNIIACEGIGTLPNECSRLEMRHDNQCNEPIKTYYIA